MSSGLIPFNVPGLPAVAQTWYQVVGDLNSTKTPLVTLHGGPGACHEYLLPLTDLDVPIVFYDQIGNGQSTHLRDKKGDTSFWTIQLFIDELNNLLRHLGLDNRPIDLLGQSWGGMLGLEWAVTPEASNLRKLVLANSLASQSLWNKGVRKQVEKMPKDLQDVFRKGEETGDYQSEEYQAALLEYFKLHLSLARPFPAKELEKTLYWLNSDDTTHSTMFGDGGLYNQGTLSNWTFIDRLDQIKVPTYIVNGDQDGSTDIANQPLFDRIEKAKWVTIDNAAHMTHIDQRKKFMKHLKSFLDADECKGATAPEL